ncbi:MAG: glycosyltransferase family A protein, partial [Pseudomonadota bacterium]
MVAEADLGHRLQDGPLAVTIARAHALDSTFAGVEASACVPNWPQVLAARLLVAYRRLLAKLAAREGSTSDFLLIGSGTGKDPGPNADAIRIQTDPNPASLGCDVNFAEAAEGLTGKERQDLLFAVLRSLGAKRVRDMGSDLFQSLPATYHKVLAQEMTILTDGDVPLARSEANAVPSTPSPLIVAKAHTADIAVLVSVHEETEVAAAAIRSADISAEQAELAGFSVQKIVALDRPTPEAQAHFDGLILKDWQAATFDFGDVSMTRNGLAAMSSARWIAFLDGDDLFCDTWLVRSAEMLRDLERCGARAIVHPELNIIFGGGQDIHVHVDQTDPMFAPEYFHFGNYYDTLCLAPRAAYLEVPFQRRDLAKGYAREDWQWNVQTMARGWEHRVARDTVIFKRRRAHSLSEKVRSVKAVVRNLPELQMNRVQGLHRADPPSVAENLRKSV